MKSTNKKFDQKLTNSRYSKFQDFHNLMRFRIRDILLVSSLYDSYIFEEDGRLYELVRREYQGLNLSHSPELVQSSNGEEALELAQKEKRFDLIIITQHIEDMSAVEFAKRAKKAGIDVPIVLLGYDNREMAELIAHKDTSVFDKIFIWQGDFRILIGIIKFLEDKINVENDTEQVGVQALILIEDNIRFYSSYLPNIYTEVLKQSQSLISEGINLSHKFLRMRARPKILLCSNYEEAWDYYKKYEDYILGIISDVDFNRNGKRDTQAGIVFAMNVKQEHPDIPILLQSNLKDNQAKAYEVGASFVEKESPTLLQDLSKFMREHFSFGDFIFRDEKYNEIARAHNLRELEERMGEVPEESIIFHASRNHFSNWLKARTEFWLAHKLRPRKVTDYPTTEALRQSLIEYISDFRRSRQQGVISDFNRETFAVESKFARIGGGSLGGKARGLGFVNRLLSNFDISKEFKKKDVEVIVPPSLVIGTDVFDQFMEDNNLRDYALHSEDDLELTRRFLNAPYFPQEIVNELLNFLQIINEPIAVRSSSLLEDSQGQPFAGVYDTYMLPNNHEDIHIRLLRLITTIKRIYASTFYQKSKDYIKVTTYRLEEEKMAVILQKLVGAKRDGKYYPEFSGVAKSFNFYPAAPLKPNDGIVSVALGLGKTIVEGGNTVRFCPKYPHHMLQYATIEDTLKYSQQEFYALNMGEFDVKADMLEDELIEKYPISAADEEGALSYVGSTYSHENETIYDGTSRPGARLFTLAPVLKYRVFPLPEIIEKLLELGSWGMGSPVEIEFAVNMAVKRGEPKQFGLLQMRPLVINNELEELDLGNYTQEQLVCSSENVLGNGIVRDIHDIIYVDIETYDRSKSRDVAKEISQLNSDIIKEDRRYLLVGVGRWGTLDPWLGIPVTWEHISGAKAIIEANFKDFNVTPSQGSHFFQNLTSFKVGYFTVNDHTGDGFIDWNWLRGLQVKNKKRYATHVQLDDPVTIKINGQENKGVIIKYENETEGPEVQ